MYNSVLRCCEYAFTVYALVLQLLYSGGVHCATLFFRGPINQLQISTWVTRKTYLGINQNMIYLYPGGDQNKKKVFRQIRRKIAARQS